MPEVRGLDVERRSLGDRRDRPAVGWGAWDLGVEAVRLHIPSRDNGEAAVTATAGILTGRALQ